MDEPTLPQEVKEALLNANHVVALTGAGVSAESGVPTFRGAGGLWENHRAEDLATPEAFMRDPALVWRWYDWRRGLIAPLSPNPGHYALARMEKKFKQFTLITQNVDGLHSKAGSAAPIEIHGNIWFARCVQEGTVRENRETPLQVIPPVCPNCGGMERPHIVWFGEQLDQDKLGLALEALENCNALIVAGTSGVVQPAASFAGMARSAGAFVIEVNTERTPVTAMAHATIRAPSGEALPLLAKLAQTASGG
ncbi:MAG: NAD-dependent deacylase [Nitrospinae bacterium]|nr:NAD-dependent deacylase [Nitrospinota bacterium]